MTERYCTNCGGMRYFDNSGYCNGCGSHKDNVMIDTDSHVKPDFETDTHVDIDFDTDTH